MGGEKHGKWREGGLKGLTEYKQIAGQYASTLHLISVTCPIFLLKSIPNYFLCKGLALPNTGIRVRPFA